MPLTLTFASGTDSGTSITRDGDRESIFAAEQLAKIKRLERNAAVKGLVEHWALFLSRAQSDSLFVSGDRRIEFGELATVTVDASIDERAWIVPRDSEMMDASLPFHDSEIA
jgi:hypothetical protein